ncbi:MAG TPA: GYDIA family GHMP kinase [Flavobacteriaceae bacterium]|nr:GYDIA family GHMP kinase [Flavobacteriaceae bacterium]
MTTHYSNGKLLLTAEYLVLNGALALAVPTVYGQSLSVKKGRLENLHWKSVDAKGEPWFSAVFSVVDARIKVLEHTSSEIANRLQLILNAAKNLNPSFLSVFALEVTSFLSFPTDWGLGSSSTLINNIAAWAEVDAYALLEASFGGSGYDIACAKNNTPITYQLSGISGKERIVMPVDFNPPFKDCLYFVYLNKKQNSQKEVRVFTAKKIGPEWIAKVSELTQKIILCKSLVEFQDLIELHEALLAEVLDQKPVKKVLFPDFNGSIKSLGAWGGDFILAASSENPVTYFKSKGFETVISYTDMVKS